MRITWRQTFKTSQHRKVKQAIVKSIQGIFSTKRRDEVSGEMMRLFAPDGRSKVPKENVLIKVVIDT